MACEGSLPRRASLALHLTRGHQRNQVPEFVRREIGADMAETPGYVFAHCYFTKRMDLGKARAADSVLF